jgi:hypothetical protein
VTTSALQSNVAPIVRSWRRMLAMFDIVQSRGLMLFLIAAFSAGSPNASNPIGRNTFSPCIRWNRAIASVGVLMYQWPMWMSPDGYGYIVKR